MTHLAESELLLNQDGSVYHLNLKPEEIADIIILVGDRDRVPLVSSFFHHIEVQKQKREFCTHTGIYRNKRISVVSTGIGTDNIDIVLNELDALLNIDFNSREVKKDLKRLTFIRIGTCGALLNEIDPGSWIFSEFAIGFDNLFTFYQKEYDSEERELLQKLGDFFKVHHINLDCTASACYRDFSRSFGKEFYKGITITAPGFYGPQGRKLRLEPSFPDLLNTLCKFNFKGMKILNYEMESSGLFGLARMLGHKAMTVNLVLANRIKGTVLENYQDKMNELIQKMLDKISEFPDE